MKWVGNYNDSDKNGEIYFVRIMYISYYDYILYLLSTKYIKFTYNKLT